MQPNRGADCSILSGMYLIELSVTVAAYSALHAGDWECWPLPESMSLQQAVHLAKRSALRLTDRHCTMRRCAAGQGSQGLADTIP